MRQIKFRGKRKHDGEWVYGYYYQTQKGEAQILQTVHPVGTWFVHPETVGQLTGLKDKNGVEIYEGDILKLPTNDFLYGDISDVQFYAGQFHVTIEYDLISVGLATFNTVWVNNGCSGDKETSLWLDEIEVIGNIHDNPELLEVS